MKPKCSQEASKWAQEDALKVCLKLINDPGTKWKVSNQRTSNYPKLSWSHKPHQIPNRSKGNSQLKPNWIINIGRRIMMPKTNFFKEHDCRKSNITNDDQHTIHRVDVTSWMCWQWQPKQLMVNIQIKVSTNNNQQHEVLNKDNNKSATIGYSITCFLKKLKLVWNWLFELIYWHKFCETLFENLWKQLMTLFISFFQLKFMSSLR